MREKSQTGDGHIPGATDAPSYIAYSRIATLMENSLIHVAIHMSIQM